MHDPRCAGYIGWKGQREHYGSTTALLAKLVVHLEGGGQQVGLDGNLALLLLSSPHACAAQVLLRLPRIIQ